MPILSTWSRYRLAAFPSDPSTLLVENCQSFLQWKLNIHLYLQEQIFPVCGTIQDTTRKNPCLSCV